MLINIETLLYEEVLSIHNIDTIQYCFYPELALYALDIYYQQQYGPDISFIPEDSRRRYAKVDYQGVGNNYNNYYYATTASSFQNTYDNTIPYYDHYHNTYRKFSSGWSNLDNVVEWIQIASDM